MASLQAWVESTQRELLERQARIRDWEEEGVRLAILHGCKTLELPCFVGSFGESNRVRFDLSDSAAVEIARRMIREAGSLSGGLPKEAS